MNKSTNAGTRMFEASLIKRPTSRVFAGGRDKNLAQVNPKVGRAITERMRGYYQNEGKVFREVGLA